MDAELAVSFAFMFIGLAFFIFMTRWVDKDQTESYNRRIMEAREFGFGGKGQHDVHTLRKK